MKAVVLHEYASAEGHFIPGMTGTGVPIRDRCGEPSASITIAATANDCCTLEAARAAMVGCTAETGRHLPDAGRSTAAWVRPVSVGEQSVQTSTPSAPTPGTLRFNH